MPEDWGKIAWCHYDSYLDRAAEEHPPGHYSLIVGLIEAVSRGDRAAIDDVGERVAFGVKESDVHALTGMALCHIGYPTDGVARLRRSVELDPCCRNKVALAGELHESGFREEKRKLCHQVLAENPDDIDALRHLAFSLLDQDQLEAVRPCITRLLQIGPNDWRVTELNAQFLFKSGDFRQAIGEYRKAIKMAFNCDEKFIWQQIIKCYHSIGDTNEARRAAVRMLRAAAREGIPPDSPTNCAILGELGMEDLIPSGIENVVWRWVHLSKP